jgi:hypothetical protein
MPKSKQENLEFSLRRTLIRKTLLRKRKTRSLWLLRMVMTLKSQQRTIKSFGSLSMAIAVMLSLP